MESIVNGFSHHIKDEKYKKAEEVFKKKQESIAWKEVNKEFPGIFSQIAGFLAFSVFAMVVFQAFSLIIIPLYIIAWFIYILKHKKLKRKAFEEKMKNVDYDNKAEEVLNIFLKGEKEVKKLGKLFSIKYNPITSSSKRVYSGEVLVSLDRTPYSVYVVNDNEFYEKDFIISDIKRFQLVLTGDIDINNANLSEYIERAENLSKIADREYIKTQLSNLSPRTGISAGFSAVSDTFSMTRHDLAAREAAESRNMLKEKIKEEEKRLLDEHRVLVFEFKDGDILLISHIVDSTHTALKDIIEKNL